MFKELSSRESRYEEVVKSVVKISFSKIFNSEQLLRCVYENVNDEDLDVNEMNESTKSIFENQVHIFEQLLQVDHHLVPLILIATFKEQVLAKSHVHDFDYLQHLSFYHLL